MSGRVVHCAFPASGPCFFTLPGGKCMRHLHGEAKCAHLAAVLKQREKDKAKSAT